MLRTSFLLAGGLALSATAAAQVTVVPPTSGPDIGVSRISSNSADIAEYGTFNGIAAFSLGSTSCNLGDEIILWNDSIDQAPVIAQNIYRVHPDGRFTQLGYSWLKDSFCALSETSCGNCILGTDCNFLGIGCADTYGSGLNDGQFGVAKFEVNPCTGVWPAFWSASPSGNSTIRGRLQCQASECADPNSTYIGEVQYVSEHDHGRGLARNNSSWIELQWSVANAANSAVFTTGGINMLNPGIFGWQDTHPDVHISEVRIVGEGGVGPQGDSIDGIYFVGSKATDLGGGTWRYDYVVHNFNSDRCVRSIEIPATGTTNLQYSDVDHHSGSPWGNTDWSSSTTASTIRWESAQTHSQNVNANAIRWGTAYSFSFEVNGAPAASLGSVSMDIFKPGTGTSLAADAIIPGPTGPPVPPANDLCSGATAVGTGTTFYTTANATSSGFNGLGGCTAPNQDVFFQFTVPSSGDYRFDTCGTAYDTRLALHDGSGCAATCLASNDDDAAVCGLGSQQSSIQLNGLAAGDLVLVQVGGVGAAEGPAQLNITEIIPPPPFNDDCSGASPVVTGATAFDTTLATDSTFQGVLSGCADGANQRDTFFQWTVPADGCYDIETCGSSFDTILAVYDGVGCSAICNDQNDDDCGLQSRVSLVDMLAGDNVLIQIGGFNGAGGPGTLTITSVSCPQPPPVNDNCFSAVPAFEGTTAWNNDSATTSGFDGGDPVNCMSPVNGDTSGLGQCHNDMFWLFTLPCDGDWQFDTNGSTGNNDTRMNLHFGTACGATCVASDDDGGDNFLSLLVLSGGLAGQTYMVQIGSWTSTSGTGDGLLNISRVGGTCPTDTISIGCDPANPHHQGGPAVLDTSSFGSGFQSGLHLECTDGPPGEFGFFLVSGGGSSSLTVLGGVLCLDSPMARYTANAANNQGNSALNSIGQFDGSGVLQNLAGTSLVGSGYDVPNALPFTPAGQSIQPGETWFFQCWFRDLVVVPGDSANFSNMVEATWQ